MCENLVHVATTIDKLQHLEYLKSAFLDTCKRAIRLVFPKTVTYVLYIKTGIKVIVFLYKLNTRGILQGHERI